MGRIRLPVGPCMSDAPSSPARIPGETGPLRVAIIGAGASGLAMAIALKKAGIDRFTIFEKSDGVGGTWRDNTYPGAGCDVPSHLYSFSFAPNPDWSRIFSPQPEILAYFEDCAKRFGLLPHCRFRTELESAAFDEGAGVWRIRTKEGEDFAAEVLVSGVGQLSRPMVPPLPGLEDFRGKTFHSARWDHGYDLRGKRVAVIGNGASAVQFVPHVAAVAAKMTLFQRSNNWITPRSDREYTGREKRWFRRFPAFRRFHRGLIYLLLEKNFFAFRPGTWMAGQMEKRARAHLAAQVKDPVLREKLTPDYPIGCKRVLVGDDYYPALVRENVEVVTEGIARVTADAIVTKDGREHPVDAIIHGTGFVTTDFLAPMHVTGRGGLRLEDAWKEGAEAYYGVAVSGFPNFFLLYGPNTNLGHNSILYMVETQVRYVMACLGEIRAKKLRWLDVKPAAMADYNRALQKDLGETVWAAGCSNWYKNESGRITNNWSGFTLRYRWRMRRPDFSAFDASPGSR
jgi:cation diffusion facilitator CzcD-associated flavoprotein CzcO